METGALIAIWTALVFVVHVLCRIASALERRNKISADFMEFSKNADGLEKLCTLGNRGARVYRAWAGTPRDCCEFRAEGAESAEKEAGK